MAKSSEKRRTRKVKSGLPEHASRPPDHNAVGRPESSFLRGPAPPAANIARHEDGHAAPAAARRGKAPIAAIQKSEDGPATILRRRRTARSIRHRSRKRRHTLAPLRRSENSATTSARRIGSAAIGTRLT
jgi:hypothetical protein